MSKTKVRKPTKPRVHRDPREFKMHYNYVQIYRARVKRTLAAIRDGEVSEVELDKLQNFCQMAVRLTEIAQRVDMQQICQELIKTIGSIRKGDIDEVELDKLQDFCKSAFDRMAKTRLVVMQQVWQDIEIAGFLKPDDENYDVVLDPVKQGRDPQDEPQHTYRHYEHNPEHQPAAGNNPADCEQVCDQVSH